jgi:hypothetical protein
MRLSTLGASATNLWGWMVVGGGCSWCRGTRAPSRVRAAGRCGPSLDGAAVAGVAEGEEADDAGEQAPRARFLRLDTDLVVPLALDGGVDVDDVL